MMKKTLVLSAFLGLVAVEAQAFGLGTAINLMRGSNHADIAAPYEPNAPHKDVTGKDDWTGFIHGTPVAGSPFEKLTIGMSEQEVKAIAGEPTNSANYTTTKSAIPGMGAGKQQNILRYKGVGRLFTDRAGGFSGTYYLVGIEYYADESGVEGDSASSKAKAKAAPKAEEPKKE